MAHHADEELIALYNLKNKRQKRRALEEDRQKQLLRAHNEAVKIYELRRSLPMVPLKEPYQKGWKRTFILRRDQWLTPATMLYEQLLNKINTQQTCNDKLFRDPLRRKKNGQKLYRVYEQTLKEFTPWEWRDPKLELTEKEKELFQPLEYWHDTYREVRVKYEFMEPWRYELVVKPHIIYQVKEDDNVLEQRENELDFFRNNAYGRQALWKYRDGSIYNWRREEECKQKKHQRCFRHKPLHVLLGNLKND